MIYLLAAANFFAIFVLWKHHKSLMDKYADLSSQLDKQQKGRFAAECEALAWKQQYQLLNQVMGKLKQVGFEASSRQ